MTAFEANFQDSRTQRVLGFLVAKGFLVGQDIEPRGDVKLNIDDVYWVGENVEPRVFEVLPGAMIHFPKTFIGKSQSPAGLVEVIQAIKDGKTKGPDFKGMRYRDIRKWANRATSDKRTKPLSKIKRNKTLRLSPEALRALETKSKNAGLSQTEFVERLLMEGTG